MKIDKILHFSISALIFMVALMFTNSVLLSFIISLAIGLGKEVWDYYNDGNADLSDIVADVLGIYFCITLYIIKTNLL